MTPDDPILTFDPTKKGRGSQADARVWVFWSSYATSLRMKIWTCCMYPNQISNSQNYVHEVHYSFSPTWYKHTQFHCAVPGVLSLKSVESSESSLFFLHSLISGQFLWDVVLYNMWNLFRYIHGRMQDSILPGCWMIKLDKIDPKQADLTVFALDPWGAGDPFAPPLDMPVIY